MTEKQETTAVQRLGHVLGWVGNAIGGWAIVFSLGTAMFFSPTIFSSDVERYRDEARAAVEEMFAVKHRNDISSTKREELIGSLRQKANLLRLKEKEAKRARSEAKDIVVNSFFGGLPFGILILLIGQALRYILAGPKKRNGA